MNLSPLKKLARILSVVGGIGAMVWAMRDRFISISAPRELPPPAFRGGATPSTTTTPSSSPGTAPAAPAVSQPDDLTEIVGIGPVFAARLREGGIDGFSALARSDVGAVADLAGVPESRAMPWIEQAAARIGS